MSILLDTWGPLRSAGEVSGPARSRAGWGILAVASDGGGVGALVAGAPDPAEEEEGRAIRVTLLEPGSPLSTLRTPHPTRPLRHSPLTGPNTAEPSA